MRSFSDVEKYKYILGLHMSRRKPVLYVGVPGTGKTSLVKDFLIEKKLKHDDLASLAMNLNSYSSSYVFQAIIMSSLDKRTGRTYGPPNNKKCMIFIDDMNMPAEDKYETQSAMMLLLQIMAYSQIYNRERMSGPDQAEKS